MRLLVPAMVCGFLAFSFVAISQRVDYSNFLSRRSGEQLLFAGQAGQHYWIETETPCSSHAKEAGNDLPERRFVLLNEGMQQTNEIELPAAEAEKIYLVAGPEHFDQLSVRCINGRTLFYLKRFSEDGLIASSDLALDSLNYSALPGQLLLCRSANRSLLMLMAFENLPDESVQVHTLLFDRNWHLLQRTLLCNPGFSQPCIQDDRIGLPGESFDNLPLKLGNQGNLVMTSVSTRNGRFALVHGCADGGGPGITEMPVRPFFQWEDVAMDIDEQKGECSVGLLSRYKKTSLKQVRVSRYNLREDRFIFDSAYQFNSLAGRLYNPGLVNESFVGIPGGGYMLFKEYGRNGVLPPQIDEEIAAPGVPVFFSALFSGGVPVAPTLKEDSYLKRSGLQGMRSQFGRGNLSMFYFPSFSGDSTWSGLINTQQQTELNRPALSYLIFSFQTRIYILYHAGEYGFSEPGSTTTLDHQGRETGDAVIFWKLNRNLDFQQAIRFSADRLAVPFQHNQQTGFAVIRLQQ